MKVRINEMEQLDKKKSKEIYDFLEKTETIDILRVIGSMNRYLIKKRGLTLKEIIKRLKSLNNYYASLDKGCK